MVCPFSGYKRASIYMLNKIRNIISQMRLFIRRFFLKSGETVLVFDLSIAGATRAGVYVFAQNISSSLKRIDRHCSIIFTNRFTARNKLGLRRKIFSILRMAHQELIVLNGLRRKIYIFDWARLVFFW